MKRLRLLVLLALLAALAVSLAWLAGGPLSARAERALQALIERELSRALGAPLTVGALELALWPPGAVVRDVALGSGGAVARLGEARATLRLRTSLRQWRPLVDIAARDVALDLPALLRGLPPPSGAPPAPLPPFRLRLRLDGARLVLTEAPEPLRVELPRLDGSVRAAPGSGRLRVAARTDAATLERGARRWAVTHLDAALAEGDAGWHLSRLALRGDDLTLSGAATDDRLAVAGSLALPRLGLIDDALGRLQGTATIDGTLTGSLEQPDLQARIAVDALGVDDHQLGRADVEAHLETGGLELSAARLVGLGGEVTGRGGLRFDAALTWEAALDWRGLAVAELAGLAAAEAPAATAAGALQGRGTVTPLALEASGAGEIAPAGGAPPVRWRGDGRWADGGTLTLEVGQGAGNRADAALAVAADGALRGTLRLHLADPDGLARLAAIESLPEMRGGLDANATLDGTLAAPRLDGTIDGRGLSLVGVRVERLGGRFAADRRALQTDLEAAIGGGRVGLRGRLALDAASDNDWSARVERVDGAAIAALARGLGGVTLPAAGGTFHLAAAARGPWARVRLDADARLDDFWLGAERLDRATAEIQVEGERWTASAYLRNRARQRLDLRASGRGTDELVLVADCPAWDLSQYWSGEAPQMGGRLRAHAELRGPPAALSGTATAAAEDLVLGGRPLGAVALEATATRGRWVASATALAGALGVDLQVRPEAGAPFSLEARWRDADFAPLLTDQRGVHLTSSGTLRGSGRLTALAASELRLELASLAMAGGPEPIVADTPLVIDCRAGRCRIDRLVLRSTDGELRVGGEVGFDGRVRLAVDGGGSFGLLELLGEPIQSARGRFTVAATVDSAAAGPNLRGHLTFEQVGLDAGLPVAITRARGRLAFDGSVVRIEELAGRVGTGRFTVGGAIDLARGPALTWTLVDVGADPLPNLEVELGGSGTLDGAWQRLRLAGELRIDQLLYDRNIDLLDFLPRLNRALANPPPPPGGGVLELALTITAPGGLYVENNLTRLEARARLALTGTSERPLFDGRVEVLDGELFLRGRTFEFLGATVDFRPDLGTRAALNITAESLIDTPDGSYVVGVRVTGTTADPRVTLTSDDPSLTQTDIATLIAVGRTTAQLRQRGGGAFSLGGALGDSVGDLLGGQAQQILPVDRVEFEPTFSTTSGAFEPQLKIGKDLTDDLTAAVGQTFGVSARTRVELEYRLGPRVWVPLSWESQTETEAGAFAAGIRLRYEFWRLTPFTLLSGLR